VKYVGIALAGLLLAAALHLALMTPFERAQVLRVTPTPEVAAGPASAAGTRDTAATRRRAAGPPAGPGAGGARVPTLPVDTGTAPAPARPRDAPRQRLLVPVRGVVPSQLSPSFTDARGEDRLHEALDIMAPTGTPVLAVADGHIVKLFDSRQGGLTIYQFDPAGRHAYYYAHLDRYAPGLAERQQVRQGEVIGYVGSSGNADPAAPHLHFAIFVLGPEKRWWEGTAIDPWPLLSGDAQ